ncbi:hypothetical protein BY458DRAFT_556062 [Sporodiniella umbellata]|nr:hypothetical protein BY458DRAFT_556062 [Sporodiniella umbellata]
MSFKKAFEQNIYQPWRNEYVCLNKLDSLDRSETDVVLELERVTRFIAKKQRELDSRISYSQRGNQEKSEVSNILLDLNELSWYTRLNYLAFEPFIINIQALDTQRFNSSLIKISRLLEPPPINKATFWIHPDHLTELRANLLFHLSPSYPEEMNDTYYDTPTFEFYKSRLQYDPNIRPIKRPGKGLIPALQVNYSRVIFGSYVTLDMQIEFSRPTTSEKWHFPYAVLSLQDPPQWLIKLVESRWIEEVPRFSKYLQGVCYFWKCPLMPWWINHPMFEHKTDNIGYLEYQLQHKALRHTKWSSPLQPYEPCFPVVTPFNLTETINLEEASIGTKVEEPTSDEQQQEKKKKTSTIEPKVFLANERTFIHWLHFASTLLNVAVTLLNFGDNVNRTVGIVFFAIAFIFAIYSFGFFRWRAHRILNKPHLRFDDAFGPVFLCVLLTGSLMLNFVLRFNAPIHGNNYLGINGTNDDS